jgi:hypothetical protein
MLRSAILREYGSAFDVDGGSDGYHENDSDDDNDDGDDDDDDGDGDSDGGRSEKVTLGGSFWCICCLLLCAVCCLLSAVFCPAPQSTSGAGMW